MSGLLKFITCGSVDDGKSTLIGHLLYDAKLIYADQEEALTLDSKVGSREGAIDYSLLLDGLMAEREQGITIDVAYRYFTTDNRSFICADTPGHEEYTRNMACGASFADLAIILIDAKQGVLIQTKRHARICALMGIKYFVFAVNKMDLVGYDENRFREIEAQIAELQSDLGLENVQIIPVSATEGDNVTNKSENIGWYDGPALLTYLENVEAGEDVAEEAGFYMPVQRVCRPNHEFRGFQGQIESGSVKVGDEITSLPSGEKANVKSILVADRTVDEAFTGQPATIQLDREVDVSRGCVLESGSSLKAADSFETEILWMDDVDLTVGKNFLVKIGTKRIPGILTGISYKIDINTGEQEKVDTLKKNEIAVCEIAVTEPIILDTFDHHKTQGELILIDRISHMTSACGIVTKIGGGKNDRSLSATRAMRSSLNWQVPMIVTFSEAAGDPAADLVAEAEFRLTRNGRHTYYYRPAAGEDYVTTAKHLYEAGLIVLLVLEEGISVDPAFIAGDGVKSWSELAGDRTVNTAADISSGIFNATNAEVFAGNYWVI